jgi:hypothetical protein
MDLCTVNEDARQCRFDQIEEFFTFHTRDSETGVNIWQYLPRGRGARGGQFVCMIYPPNPHNRELFATYLLSIALRGIQSFQDLRSLNRDYIPIMILPVPLLYATTLLKPVFAVDC